jgi:hypothetical protein
VHKSVKRHFPGRFRLPVLAHRLSMATMKPAFSLWWAAFLGCLGLSTTLDAAIVSFGVTGGSSVLGTIGGAEDDVLNDPTPTILYSGGGLGAIEVDGFSYAWVLGHGFPALAGLKFSVDPVATGAPGTAVATEAAARRPRTSS